MITTPAYLFALALIVYTIIKIERTKEQLILEIRAMEKELKAELERVGK